MRKPVDENEKKICRSSCCGGSVPDAPSDKWCQQVKCNQVYVDSGHCIKGETTTSEYNMEDYMAMAQKTSDYTQNDEDQSNETPTTDDYLKKAMEQAAAEMKMLEE